MTSDEQITDTQIDALRAEACMDNDDAQVDLCDRALAGDTAARAECERVIREAQAQQDDQDDEQVIPGEMTGAIAWAREANDGDYLVEYDDDGVPASKDDPGSRCGWDDAQHAEIEAVLRKRGLTLEADDTGLVARTRD